MHVDVLSSLTTISPLGGSTYCHGTPKLARHLATNTGNIAYWMCESSQLHPEYKKASPRFDKIWTASSYCAQILENELKRKVSIVPHYTDRVALKPIQKDLVILIAFDAHSRLQRKNPTQAIQAVRAAFSTTAKIIIKTRHLSASLTRWLAAECGDTPYEIINSQLSPAKLTNLYLSASIYLSLHRSEGFGLHLLEAMAHGLYVVATNFGGCTDFLTVHNSFPVEHKLVDVTDDYFFGQWAEPDLDSAVSQLRSAASADASILINSSNTSLLFDKTNTTLATRKALQSV